MYVLQALLLILKLMPLGSCLFFWGVDLRQPLINGVDPAIVWNKPYINLYPDFSTVSWWIILIPSFFIIVRSISGLIIQKTLNNGR